MNRTQASSDRGFSLIELIAVVATVAVIVAVAAPQIGDSLTAMRLGDGARAVERELQTARLKAVATNRIMRVRLNCPAAGFYRMVEYLGTIQAVDARDIASNRCLQSAYPYPAADTNPVTRPNHDGPIRVMPAGVTVTDASIEFRPDGTAWLVGAGGLAQSVGTTGTDLTVTHKTKTKRINVNPMGKVAIR